ncbi:MAG: L-rhamnose/proton symporter RhaT [Sphingomonas bacterium]
MRVRSYNVLWVVCFHFFLTAGTMYFTASSEWNAPLWPSNALLLAMMLQPLRARWRDVLLVGVGSNMSANMLVNHIFSAPLLFSVIDVIEVTIVAAGLRRSIKSGDMLGAPENLGTFILWAGGVAPTISALSGATVSLLHHRHEAFSEVFRVWFLSDALGLLIFTPFFISVLGGEYRRWFTEKTMREQVEALFMLLLVAAVAVMVFMLLRHPIPGLLFAPLMLVTFRTGRLGIQVAIMIVAIIGTMGARMSDGPFAIYAAAFGGRMHLMQLFLALMLLTCLPVAASLSGRARLTRQLAESERQLRARERELLRLTVTDPLTGLLNRAAVNERIEQTREAHEGMAVAVLDLDCFKQVNDRFGHDGGDRALIHFARLIEGGIRHGDAAARSGGDEFMIFFPGTSAGAAEKICERLAETLRGLPLEMDGNVSVSLRMSCGIAEQRGGETIEGTIKRADQALYAAKAAGRSRVQLAA